MDTLAEGMVGGHAQFAIKDVAEKLPWADGGWLSRNRLENAAGSLSRRAHPQNRLHRHRIIVVWRRIPEWTPFTLAILFGSHFLPYARLNRSRAYAALAIGVVGSTTIAVLIARGP